MVYLIHLTQGKLPFRPKNKQTKKTIVQNKLLTLLAILATENTRNLSNQIKWSLGKNDKWPNILKKLCGVQAARFLKYV